MVWQDEVMELLKTFVEINSHSGNPQGLEEMGALLEKSFACLHAKLKRFGNTLVYRKREEAPIQLFLGGHYDTVYPKECPFQKLEKLSKSRWRGPGVSDMKGGLVLLLEALRAFEKEPHKDRIGWRLVLNGDEEVGSPISRKVIESVAIGCQAALFFEPAFADGRLASSRKGSLSVRIVSRGKRAHAGRNLHAGKNAIVPLADLICRLKRLRGINIAEISGGEAYNLVPDFAELKVNFRSEKERAFDTFRNLLSGWEWYKASWRPPKPFDAKTKKLMSLLNYPVGAIPTGGVCDGNFTAALGIPTVDTLGVVGGNLHTYEEYIEIESLHERKEWFLQFLNRVAKLC